MIKTLRTLGWVIWLFGYMLTRLPMGWKANRLEKQGRMEERRALLDAAVSDWANKLLRHVKVQVRVKGQQNLPPKEETVVFCANHQSFIDIPVVLGKIVPPHPLLARREIGKVPLLGGFMKKIGCVLVQREDVRSAMVALKEAEELVKSGTSLYVFPEGTRAKSSQIGTFQPGAMRIASRAGVRIVPVAIEGSYKALEGNGYRVRSTKDPVEVVLSILPPVETKGLTKEEQKQLPGRLEEMIRAAKDEK